MFSFALECGHEAASRTVALPLVLESHVIIVGPRVSLCSPWELSKLSQGEWRKGSRQFTINHAFPKATSWHESPRRPDLHLRLTLLSVLPHCLTAASSDQLSAQRRQLKLKIVLLGSPVA